MEQPLKLHTVPAFIPLQKISLRFSDYGKAHLLIYNVP